MDEERKRAKAIIETANLKPFSKLTGDEDSRAWIEGQAELLAESSAARSELVNFCAELFQAGQMRSKSNRKATSMSDMFRIQFYGRNPNLTDSPMEFADRVTNAIETEEDKSVVRRRIYKKIAENVNIKSGWDSKSNQQYWTDDSGLGLTKLELLIRNGTLARILDRYNTDLPTYFSHAENAAATMLATLYELKLFRTNKARTGMVSYLDFRRWLVSRLGLCYTSKGFVEKMLQWQRQKGVTNGIKAKGLEAALNTKVMKWNRDNAKGLKAALNRKDAIQEETFEKLDLLFIDSLAHSPEDKNDEMVCFIQYSGARAWSEAFLWELTAKIWDTIPDGKEDVWNTIEKLFRYKTTGL